MLLSFHADWLSQRIYGKARDPSTVEITDARLRDPAFDTRFHLGPPLGLNDSGDLSYKIMLAHADAQSV